MHKLFLLFIAATIPGVIFLTVRQVNSYNQVDTEVHSLILDQRELFEQNKRMVANLSILSSPGRIDNLAENVLGMEKIDIETVRIKANSAREISND
jgi:hypothetical protein